MSVINNKDLLERVLFDMSELLLLVKSANISSSTDVVMTAENTLKVLEEKGWKKFPKYKFQTKKQKKRVKELVKLW